MFLVHVLLSIWSQVISVIFTVLHSSYLQLVKGDHLAFVSSLYPTGPFTILELQYQEIREFYVVQVRRATDFEAPKL